MAKRVLIGTRNGAPGIFVSRPGEDVDTATDLLLDSVSDLTKPFIQGRIDRGVWVNGVRQTITIQHNLGYVPFFMLKGEGSIRTYSGNNSTIDLGLATSQNYCYPRITATALYMVVPGDYYYGGTGTQTYIFPTGAYIDWAVYEMRMF